MPNDPFATAMLAAGWSRHEDIAGQVTWKHEHSPLPWQETRARLFWQAGDEPHTPPAVNKAKWQQETEARLV
jgi:hypothetical protein